MKHKRIYLIASLAIGLALAATLIIYRLQPIPNATTPHSITPSGKYTYLSGTVTSYDVTPSYSDGPIVFQVDGRSIDIGGGLRSDNPTGAVYQPIAVGDRVVAKLLPLSNGSLTIYGCPECYIRKQ